MPSIPRVTRILILLNVAVFLLQRTVPDQLEEHFALYPLGVGFEVWQLFSYAFLHASYAHILFNMLALYMFGSPLEHYLGAKRFTWFYFICVLTAGMRPLAVTFIQGSDEPTIGSSGGVFGLPLGFAMFLQRERIVLLFPPIPMPAWLFVTGYGIIELLLGATATQSGVAHFAHLGGMLGGYLTILWWRYGSRRA